ncbi:hypothetical protein AAFF_G00116410 [Aldrovandia affinis]|uniref:Uncharacterized protein n=1 Tax=Aldrovandia affinis TaxID=143900 RepID=A0AAD7T1V6_9TELE|nr:hypothetical protein AAFF_G00116410 [Aldrovandia affinis]
MLLDGVTGVLCLVDSCQMRTGPVRRPGLGYPPGPAPLGVPHAGRARLLQMALCNHLLMVELRRALPAAVMPLRGATHCTASLHKQPDAWDSLPPLT